MKKIVFAENLKKYREMKGISKEELGERIGVSGVTIGYWEKGRNEPRMGKVEMIAEILNIEVDDLMFNNTPAELHNPDISEIKRRAIELIMSLPDDEVELFSQLMERSIKNNIQG